MIIDKNSDSFKAFADNTEKAESVYDTLIKALKPGDVMTERVIRGRDLPLKKQKRVA